MTLEPAAPLEGMNPVIRGATVKLPALVAVPAGVVTWIWPVVASAGTAAMIRVAVFIEKLVAGVTLNVTDVAPARLVPLIVTLTPAAPLVGEMLVIVGTTPTVKLVALVAVPEGVVTLIGPVVAPDGTLAVICVSESWVKDGCGVPLNVTDVAPARCSPVIVTIVPTAPPPGVKLVIVGGGGRTATLFAPLGSDTVDATVALLVIVPPTPGVTTIVAVATAAAASEPRSHRTSRKGKLTTMQEPWLEVAEFTVEISTGIRSRSLTPVAASGPLFVTMSVYVKGIPVVAGSGEAVMLMARSAEVVALSILTTKAS